MKLKMIRDYMAFRAGTVCEVNNGIAEILLKRGFAKYPETESEKKNAKSIKNKAS